MTRCSLSFAKKRNPDKNLKDKHIKALNSYVLEELPLLAFGFVDENRIYNHLIHPVKEDSNGFPELIAAVEYFQLSSPDSLRRCSISDLSIDYINPREEELLINC
ncbi:MAG: hypothetical protein AB8E15_04460 [Bdellovibrionales bacterium]